MAWFPGAALTGARGLNLAERKERRELVWLWDKNGAQVPEWARG